MDDIELESPLPPHECAARLREATGDDGLLTGFGMFNSRPAVGRVSGTAVRIRKRTSYAGSFQTILTGHFMEHEGGTVFRGRTTNWTPINAFIMFGFGMTALGYGIITLLSLAEFLGIDMPGRMVSDGPIWGPAVNFLLMITIAISMSRVFRRVARDERRFLIAFIIGTVSSSSAPERLPPTPPT